MTRGTRTILPLVAALTLQGCSNATAPESVLSQAELQAAVLSIFNVAVIRPVGEVPGGGDTEAGPEVAPVRFDSETIEVFPCDLGGEVETLTRTVGFIDDETANSEVDFLVELDHSSCIEGVGSARVTLEGNPGIEATYEFDRQPDGSLVIFGGIVGTVSVITEDANLVCRASIGISGSDVDDVFEYSFAGSFCESAVQGTIR